MKKIRYIAVLLLALLEYTAYAQEVKTNPTDTTIAFKVFGVCEQCKARIQKSLKIKGVRSAS